VSPPLRRSCMNLQKSRTAAATISQAVTGIGKLFSAQAV
jgi:hypothetical protein